MDDLVTFLRARLDEDDLWATEASRTAGSDQIPDGGDHWGWTADDTDTCLTPVPSNESTLGYEVETCYATLCSYDDADSSPLSELTSPAQFILHAKKVPSAAAGHIIRHDPARVLREVEAKRRLLDVVLPDILSGDSAIEGEWMGESDMAGDLARTLALPYADHPDYRDDWRP
ncbi:DUF6221 family protein [Streptomyces sp. NPDC053707]|uniref:DUF6221 family protein n=1 Tax=Streptomyces sp. NPDC053707 TaxID=3365712 RepID=UPI0037D76D55